MAEDLYSLAQIEQWQKNLAAIAQTPRTTFTKKQAVEALIDHIEKALETRSFDEVASGLKEWGLDIPAGSLKQYVARYRKSHPAAADTRKRSSKAKRKGGAVSAAAKANSAATTAETNGGKSNEKPVSSSKPSRFVEMDEDL